MSRPALPLARDTAPVVQTGALILAVVTTVLLWAAAFVGIRAGLAAYSPAHLALLRFLVASVVLALVAVLLRPKLPTRAAQPRVVLCGLIGITAYNLALNTGERSVPAATASLLVNTAPIWTALLGALVLHERLRVWGWIGIGVSFGGAVAIAFDHRGGPSFSPGAAWVLLAALCQSVFFIAQKPLLRAASPLAVTTAVVWAGTLGMVPFANGLPEAIAAAPPSITLAVVFLGVGPAALAYLTWAYVLARLPAGQAASLLYLVPPTTMLIGWLWLSELPTLLAVGGGLLAIGGIAIVTRLGKEPS